MQVLLHALSGNIAANKITHSANINNFFRFFMLLSPYDKSNSVGQISQIISKAKALIIKISDTLNAGV